MHFIVENTLNGSSKEERKERSYVKLLISKSPDEMSKHWVVSIGLMTKYEIRFYFTFINLL